MGQKVFLVDTNTRKLVEIFVRGIISIVEEKQNDAKVLDFKYLFEPKKNVFNLYSHEWVNEQNIFATKEEYIASL